MKFIRKPSSRELVVLEGVKLEKTSKEIAREMGVSPGTVDDKRKNILYKTGAKTMMGAVLIAVKQGWISICLAGVVLFAPVDRQAPTPRTNPRPTSSMQARPGRRAEDVQFPMAA